MTPRRFLTAMVLAFALLAAAAPAGALAQDNAAVAVNTKNDSSLFRLAFSIKQVGGEVIDQQNAAVAYSSCEACQTVAIAIQVLIYTTESPDVVTPTNLAIAINESCESCVTMALAYQFVLGGQPLRLTAEGRRELARIRHELRELGKEDLSAEEIRVRTAALVKRIREVLATELVPRGPGDDEDEQSDERSAPEDEQPEDEQPDGTETEPAPAAPEEPAPETTETAPEPGTTTTP